MCSTPAPPSTPLRRREDLVGHRRGEHLAAGGRVEHPQSDEPAVQRLVTRPAAGDQADLAGPGCVAAEDHLVLVVDAELRVGGLDAEQGLGEDVGRGIDELLHGRLLLLLDASGAAGGLGTTARQPVLPLSAAVVLGGAADEGVVGAERPRRRPASSASEVDRQLLPLHRAAGELLDEHRAEGAGRVDRGAGGRGDRDDRREHDEADGHAGEPGRRLGVDDAEDR